MTDARAKFDATIAKTRSNLEYLPFHVAVEDSVHGSAVVLVAELDAEIVRLRAALAAVTPSEIGCVNTVEIERDRFGLYVHINGTSIDWPDALGEQP